MYLFSTNLGDNCLVSLQAFRRICAPKLNWIDLSSYFVIIETNKIFDHNPLSEFYNPSKRFTRIHVSVIGSSAAIFKVEG